MSCTVIDIELTDKNAMKDVGVFIEGKIQGNSFRPPKKYKPKKQTTWCTRNFHGIVCKSGRLDYSELPNILPYDVKGKWKHLAKGKKNAGFLRI